MWLFQKLGPRTHPGPTENTETPKNGLRRAKIGINAPHVVQLTGFGPKKPNLNRFVPRCVPFTRNQPMVLHIRIPLSGDGFVHLTIKFIQRFFQDATPCCQKIFSALSQQKSSYILRYKTSSGSTSLVSFGQKWVYYTVHSGAPRSCTIFIIFFFYFEMNCIAHRNCLISSL